MDIFLQVLRIFQNTALKPSLRTHFVIESIRSHVKLDILDN